jgi:hypothetical protein
MAAGRACESPCCLQELETVWLAGSKYVAGSQPCIADLLMVCELEQLTVLNKVRTLTASKVVWGRLAPCVHLCTGQVNVKGNYAMRCRSEMGVTSRACWSLTQESVHGWLMLQALATHTMRQSMQLLCVKLLLV